MKKKSKRRAFALLLCVVLLFFFYQELSWPGDEAVDTEIERIMIFIERYNSQMPNCLRFRVAREIYWAASREPNLNIPLLCGLIAHESARTWDPKVVSPAGAVGLMQILPSTARGILIFSESRDDGKEIDLPEITVKQMLCDPVINIRIGSRYLSSLIERNGLSRGLIAYYMGEARMKCLLKEKGDRIPVRAERYLSAVFQFYSEMI